MSVEYISRKQSYAFFYHVLFKISFSKVLLSNYKFHVVTILSNAYIIHNSYFIIYVAHCKYLSIILYV